MSGKEDRTKVIINSQLGDSTDRYLNPQDIYLPPEYNIEIFAQGLNTPTCMIFTERGDLITVDSGLITGNPLVLRMNNGQFEVLAENFNAPIIGLNYRDGDIYVSHKGVITVLRQDGTRRDLIIGLPSEGDYANSRVAFGQDGKMYFGQGTATNSGVVGNDNYWVKEHPYFHDNAGDYIILNGQNYETSNLLIDGQKETVLTGAFSPYGIPNLPYETRKRITRASGGILRADLDGSKLELIAWGLRSIAYVKFDNNFRLFASNNGYDVRGSRPIANALEELHIIIPGTWYGWPDYSGGEPLTLPKFTPEGGAPTEFLLTNHPSIPPRPFATFPADATVIGFDFNYNIEFGQYGDIYIAEFGIVRPGTIDDPGAFSRNTGHRIARIDHNTGQITTFAINRSGFPASITREGGFGRPADINFGPDGAMYVIDVGTNPLNEPSTFIPNTGVIWRITRNKRL
jgi:glucose/arabinose dehydrogenase